MVANTNLTEKGRGNQKDRIGAENHQEKKFIPSGEGREGLGEYNKNNAD